jgi:DNA-binding beta-propeller fold protein YncE
MRVLPGADGVDPRPVGPRPIRPPAVLRALGLLASLTAVVLLVSCEDDPTWGLQYGDAELIRFESTLSELEMDPGRGLLYAGDQLKNVIWAIDVETDEVVSSIPIGSRPIAIEMDPSASELYVALEGADAVAIVDLDQQVVRTTISLPFEPVFVEPTGDGRFFAGPAQLSDGNAVSVDVATGAILHEFLGERGQGVTGGIACDGDSVAIIGRGEDLHKWNIRDPAQAVHQITIELDQYHFDLVQLELLSEKGQVYVAGLGGSTTTVEVYRISDLVKVGELYTERPVVYVCLSPDGKRAYVGTSIQPTAESNTVAAQAYAFDTTTFARTTQYSVLGRMAASGMAVSPDESKLYVIVENPYLIFDNPAGDLRRDIQIIQTR